MQNSSSTLTERMAARALENAAQRAAMTGADRRREERALAVAKLKCRRYLADIAHRAGDHAYARRLLATPPTVPRQARPRGAGRPGGKRTASSSTTSSSDPGEPEPALAVTIAAGDGATGDSAVARMLEHILAARHPGTTWSAA